MLGAGHPASPPSPRFQDEGAHDVRDHADHQHHAQDPEQTLVGEHGVERVAQPVRVRVEGLGALIDLEIADHVDQDIGREHQAGNGHDVFGSHG